MGSAGNEVFNNDDSVGPYECAELVFHRGEIEKAREAQAEQEQGGVYEKAAGGVDDILAARDVRRRISPGEPAGWNSVDEPSEGEGAKMKEWLARTEQNADMGEAGEARSDGVTEFVRDDEQILENNQKCDEGEGLE